MACNWDESRKSTATVIRDDEPKEIVDSYLQRTYYKTEIREEDRSTERRTADGDSEECRQRIVNQRYRQQWGHFCVRLYNAKRTRSWWYYVGWTLLAIGVVVVVVITGGVALGFFAAGGAIVATGGGLTATGATILAAGGLSFGAGVSLVRGVPDDYEREPPPRRTYETDAPTTDWERVGSPIIEYTDWEECDE